MSGDVIVSLPSSPGDLAHPSSGDGVIYQSQLSGFAFHVDGRDKIPLIDSTWDIPSIAAYLKAWKLQQHSLPKPIKDVVSKAIVATLIDKQLRICKLKFLIRDPTLPASFYRINWKAFIAAEATSPARMSQPEIAASVPTQTRKRPRKASKAEREKLGNLIQGTKDGEESALPPKKRKKSKGRTVETKSSDTDSKRESSSSSGQNVVVTLFKQPESSKVELTPNVPFGSFGGPELSKKEPVSNVNMSSSRGPKPSTIEPDEGSVANEELFEIDYSAMVNEGSNLLFGLDGNNCFTMPDLPLASDDLTDFQFDQNFDPGSAGTFQDLQTHPQLDWNDFGTNFDWNGLDLHFNFTNPSPNADFNNPSTNADLDDSSSSVNKTDPSINVNLTDPNPKVSLTDHSLNAGLVSFNPGLVSDSQSTNLALPEWLPKEFEQVVAFAQGISCYDNSPSPINHLPMPEAGVDPILETIGNADKEVKMAQNPRPDLQKLLESVNDRQNGPRNRQKLRTSDILQLRHYPNLEELRDRKFNPNHQPSINGFKAFEHIPYFAKAVVIQFLETRRRPQLDPELVISTMRCLIPGFTNREREILELAKDFVSKMLCEYEDLYDILKAICKADPRVGTLMVMVAERSDLLYRTRDDEIDNLGIVLTFEEMLRLADASSSTGY